MHITITNASSGWDVAAAIGTIAGAVATAAAVIAALLIGARDRREAREAIQKQLDSAKQLQAHEHAEQRRRRAQEHEIDLLLRLADLIGDWAAGQTVANQAVHAQAKGRAVAAALLDPIGVDFAPPPPGSMPAVRAIFGVDMFSKTNLGVTAYQNLYRLQFEPNAAAERASAEIAERLREVAGS